MALHRVPPISHSVAQVRHWVVENVPGTDSMLGYDLFLRMGKDMLVPGQALPLAVLAQGLPYAPEEIVAQLQRFAEHDLLTLAADAEHGLTLMSTARLLSLLDLYGLVFDRFFIVRQELRSQQLLVHASDPALGDFGRMLYDRMYDLGWLYLHNFGSACFLVASLVRRLAELHGRSARVASCYVDIQGREGEGRYLLGAQGYAKPGQIDGHAVCVIDEAIVVDFGLGNVRKGYRSDFHWGTVCDLRRDGARLASLALPGGATMCWKDDWQSPGSDAELARYAPHIDHLAVQYVERYR